MSNDNKTLADVQPGGMVRLATVPYDRARDLMGDAYNAGTHGIGYSQQAMELHDAIFPVRRSPATCKEGLQVHPSPGGQGDAWDIAELVRTDLDRQSCPDAYMRIAMESVVKHLAARQPVTMDDALAAGDGTLHGAIDHWQERALRAEAELAARQPVGEPVGHLFRVVASDEGAAQPWKGRSVVYTEGPAPVEGRSGFGQYMNVYAAPTEQAVDLGRWALHLMGPDDVHPAPSKADALEVANAINRDFANSQVKPYAVVVPWIGSESAHTEGLNDWAEQWSGIRADSQAVGNG